jgi:guanylate kinase
MLSLSRSKGIIILFSSPSGGGKTSLIRHLIKCDHHLRQSISVTTRPKKLGERDGVDYEFKTFVEFEEMMRNNHLIEYATIYNNYYGTSKRHVQSILAQGLDLVFDLDWQGVKAVKKYSPAACSIFILPPNIEVLKKRLNMRGRDTQEEIDIRMRKVNEEIDCAKYYDYVVLNDDFDSALQQIQSIIVAERIKSMKFESIKCFNAN